MIQIERTKFNVDRDTVKRTYDNVTFASVLEMQYFRDVVLPKMGSGEIVAYELQKPYELQPKFSYHGKMIQPISYVSDFYLQFSDGTEKVIDVKGMADATAKIKRKLFRFIYPDLPYEWVSYSQKDGGWLLYDDLQALRRARKKKSKNNKENVHNG